jgi:peptidyl-prolyl cis-trans isomerase SurA
MNKFVTAPFSTLTLVHRAVLAALCSAACLAWPALAQTEAPLPETASSVRSADFIVAVVNSEPITNQEVISRMQRLVPQLAMQGRPVPPRAEFAKAVLERLISERAQLQAAREGGIRISDEAVDQAAADVARQNQVSMAELRRRLASDGLSLERFRQDLRDELLLARLREREVDGRVRVSEQDVDRFMAEKKSEAAAGPVELNVAQILVAVPEGASPAQLASLEARARQIRQRVDSGADFAALAKDVSEASDRANGGELGLRSADRLPPLFVEAVGALQVGAVAGPVRSGAGFHLLKLLEKKQAGDAQSTITQTRARHILLKPSPRLSEGQARQRLAQFKRRIEAGQADFAQLAREFSEDGSARDGGDLGWTSPGAFVPEFEQVMDMLRPGQLAEPLQSRFGLHLIGVIERREVQLSDRDRRELARRDLREEKTEEALRIFLQDVRGRAYVEYRDAPQ